MSRNVSSTTICPETAYGRRHLLFPGCEMFQPPLAPQAPRAKDRQRVAHFREALSCGALRKAAQLFDRASQHARSAFSTAPQQFPESQVVYLEFWTYICVERLGLFTFMETGHEPDFVSARVAWSQALEQAEKFVAQRGQEALFPNRFYSLSDLKIEKLLLDAAYAFRERDWNKCGQFLENWRERFPIEYRWSWRDVQVLVRLLLCKALAAFERGDADDVRARCTELQHLAETEPIGNTARLLINEATSLQWKQGKVPEDLADLLFKKFSLDAYTSSYETAQEIDLLTSFRKRVYAWLEQARSPSSPAEYLESRAKLCGAVEALLGQVVDYHLQVMSPSELVPEPSNDTLLDKLILLAQSNWKDRTALPSSLESLKRALSDLEQIGESGPYKDCYERIRGALEEMARLVPVVIEIRSSVATKQEPRAILSFPDWKLEEVRVGRERILIFANPELLVDPGWYYLPPEWRKGSMLSYRLSARQPLRPIRLFPRWDVWEWLAANAYFLQLEGVTLQHLEEAINLAAQSIAEHDKAHPRVGAVIVKGGKVLAGGFRNEDGQGGHAELNAIRKCGDSKKLKDAIMITTLEPCSYPRVGELPCVEHIIRNKMQKVIIGIPDPNPKIRGNGDRALRVNGIDVAYFPSSLSKRVWEMNQDFIERHIKNDFEDIRLPY